MAAFTSKSSGNFSASGQTTWNEAGVPGDGDTVYIGPNHTVTLTADATIGTSGATGVAAVTIGYSGGSYGVLALSSHTLTCRGDLILNVGYNESFYPIMFTIGAGGKLILDPPTGEHYVFQVGGAFAKAKWTTAGTSEAWAEVACGTRGGTCAITTGSTAGAFTGSYTRFRGLGTASVAAVESSASTDEWVLSHGEFIDCGYAGLTVTQASDVNLDNITFSGGLHATYDLYLNSAAPNEGVVRRVTNCRFGKQFQNLNWSGFVIDGCVFETVLGLDGAGTGAWTSADGLFITCDQSGQPIWGSVTNSVLYIPATSNTHGFFPKAGLVTDSLELSDNVIYYNGTDNDGDVIFATSELGALTPILITRNILLPNAADGATGSISTFPDITTHALTITHNTIKVAGTTGLYIGHLQTTIENPNRYISVSGNLFYGDSTGYAISTDQGQVLEDIIPVSALTANARYGIKTTGYAVGHTNAGNGYDCKWSVTPGSSDVTSDPGFLDSTRNPLSWSTYKGGNGSFADVIARLNADPSLITSDLLPWIRAGFAPSNVAYNDTAPGGGDFDAVAYAAIIPDEPTVTVRSKNYPRGMMRGVYGG